MLRKNMKKVGVCSSCRLDEKKDEEERSMRMGKVANNELPQHQPNRSHFKMICFGLFISRPFLFIFILQYFFTMFVCIFC